MERKNLWASPHSPTPEQIEKARKFVFLKDVNPDLLDRLIDCPDEANHLYDLAELLLDFCREENYNLYQPAGSPAFQFALGFVSKDYRDVLVCYSHSDRKSSEEIQPDNSVKKVSIFEFKKFIGM